MNVSSSLIISELCQNHLGNISTLRDMVAKSAEAGAEFAKIQTFFANDCLWADDRERLKKLELSWPAHQAFVAACKRNGIKPMTSVYTFSYANELWDLGFRYIKIGSAQNHDEGMIKKYAEKGFKIIVSTGGTDLSNIARVNPCFGVLHCVSEYPHSPYKANISRMLDISKFFFDGSIIGLSDHADPKHDAWDLPSKLAMYLGAGLIEKHFTVLSRSKTKDGPVSITLPQLKELVRYSRLTTEEMLEENPEFGLYSYPSSNDESDLIDKYRSRWVKK